MEPPVIAAIIAGSAAVIAGVANLYLGYRLKVKEFRVTQLQSRIGTLEQAAVFRAPQPDAGEDKLPDDADPFANAVNGIKRGMWHRLGETERQYTKYKWLDPESHVRIEELLEDANARSGRLGIDSLKLRQMTDPPRDDMNKFQADLVSFGGITDDLQKAYEDARLSAIRQLYLELETEVQIARPRALSAKRKQ